MEIDFIDITIDARSIIEQTIAGRIGLLLPVIRAYSESPKQGRAAPKIPSKPSINKQPNCAFARVFPILGNIILVIVSRGRALDS